MNNHLLRSTSVFIATMFGFSACDTPGEGAKYGAIIGAAAGGLHEGTIEGAAVGAAIGAATGALTGKIRQERRRARYEQEYPEDRYYNENRDQPRDASYPMAKYDRPGYVRSPYKPYHLIDVRGIPTGSEVVDPSCDRVFINP